MDTIILREKDFIDGVYCGKEDLTNIKGNLKIEKTGWCRFETYIFAKGYISAEGYISAKGNIFAEGDIFAKGNISAQGGISAQGYISAEGGILKATYGITAGLKIYAKTTIECGMRIFAGTSPWNWVTKEHREIKCGKLLSGKVAYGDLIETGLPEDDEVSKALQLLEEKGVLVSGKIIK